MARRIGLGEHAADSGRMTLCGFRHAAQEALRVPARQFAGHPGFLSGRDPAKASLDSKLPSDNGRGSRLERVCNNLPRLLGERAGAAHILPRGRDWGMHPQGDPSRARRQVPLRHDETRAIDRDGNQVQTSFDRQHETARIEHPHPPIGAARTASSSGIPSFSRNSIAHKLIWCMRRE